MSEKRTTELRYGQKTWFLKFVRNIQAAQLYSADNALRSLLKHPKDSIIFAMLKLNMQKP